MSTGPWRCRLKDLFEFAQGRDARESWLGDPGLAARHDVQHPERHFQNPRCLDVFQAAVRHRPAAFYESGMYPYCPAVPRMPGIADFTEIPNMGVVLLTCTIGSGITRARATFCCSPLPMSSVMHVDCRFNVGSVSAVFSSITTQGPHEFLDYTGSNWARCDPRLRIWHAILPECEDPWDVLAFSQ